MKKFSETELEEFDKIRGTVGYRVLIELLENRIKAYDELIYSEVKDIASIAMQQQHIGAKKALEDFKHSHIEYLKQSNQ